jgi:hypothetical protein
MALRLCHLAVVSILVFGAVGCGDGSDDPAATPTPGVDIVVEEICYVLGPLTPTVCGTPVRFCGRQPCPTPTPPPN